MPGKLVSRISKRKCFTISEVDTIKSASQKFHENQIGCMPVLYKNKTSFTQARPGPPEWLPRIKIILKKLP